VENIRVMIDNVLQGNNTEALDAFNTVISGKVDDSLSARKTEIAATIGEKDEDTE
jgi:hypothetical protein